MICFFNSRDGNRFCVPPRHSQGCCSSALKGGMTHVKGTGVSSHRPQCERAREGRLWHPSAQTLCCLAPRCSDSSSVKWRCRWGPYSTGFRNTCKTCHAEVLGRFGVMFPQSTLVSIPSRRGLLSTGPNLNVRGRCGRQAPSIAEEGGCGIISSASRWLILL